MKTAVEWFESEDWKLRLDLGNNDISYQQFGLKHEELLQEARAMELAKLKEAYSMGRLGKSIKEFNETFNTMKTPKEKAMYLFDKYVGFKLQPYDDPEMSLKKELARAHALIAVDEVLEALDGNQWQNRNYIDYYKEVKLELEKI